MKKYELTDETKTIGSHILHRIRALRDFGDVESGDLGGWIESENNLSQNGNCWVFGNARIYDNARVDGNAHVYDNARVDGNAHVDDNAYVCDNVHVDVNAYVGDNACVDGTAHIAGNAYVGNNAYVGGDAVIKHNAYITSSNDYITVGPLGSRFDRTTFYLDKDKHIWVVCGCFNDTIEAFEEKVKERHGNSVFRQTYIYSIEYAKKIFDAYSSKIIRNTNDSENILLK